jgi:hypothetical protein
MRLLTLSTVSDYQVTRGASRQPIVGKLFGYLATAEVDRFLVELTPDVVVKLGNAVYTGHDEVRDFLEGLYAFTTVTHSVVNEWVLGNETIVEAVAHYVRHADGKKIQIPTATVITTSGDLVHTYYAYVDPAPLYAD